MILYVNGDSHSAGAEATNRHAFAEDDPAYRELGRRPHPDNLKVSYGALLANQLGAELVCDAESAGSIPRILRTTKQYLESNRPDCVVIGWPTFEREEWLHNGVYWQICAGRAGGDWPPELKHRFMTWVIEQADFEVINQKYLDVHLQIHDFHQYLTSLGLKHYFFNTYSDFKHLELLEHPQAQKLEWDGCYLEPYDPNYTYYNWCLAQGLNTVSKNSYHFGVDAHAAWAEFLYPKIQKLLD